MGVSGSSYQQIIGYYSNSLQTINDFIYMSLQFFWCNAYTETRPEPIVCSEWGVILNKFHLQEPLFSMQDCKHLHFAKSRCHTINGWEAKLWFFHVLVR